MILQVELEAEIQPGKPVNWVAHTNRFHFPGWAGTAIGEGPSPSEALTALGRDLDRIAKGAVAEPTEVFHADPLERVSDAE